MNSRKAPPGSGGATALALLGLLLAAFGLIALASMVMPRIVGFLAVLFGLFLFGALHYVMWGWWLGVPKPGDDGDEDVGE